MPIYGTGFGYISATIDDESTCSVDESSGSSRSKYLDYYDNDCFSISSMDAMMLGSDKKLNVHYDGVSIRSLTKPEKSILLTHNKYHQLLCLSFFLSLQITCD